MFCTKKGTYIVCRILGVAADPGVDVAVVFGGRGHMIVGLR
jgi:hypothetical protein